MKTLRRIEFGEYAICIPSNSVPKFIEWMPFHKWKFLNGSYEDGKASSGQMKIKPIDSGGLNILWLRQETFFHAVIPSTPATTANPGPAWLLDLRVAKKT